MKVMINPFSSHYSLFCAKLRSSAPQTYILFSFCQECSMEMTIPSLANVELGENICCFFQNVVKRFVTCRIMTEQQLFDFGLFGNGGSLRSGGMKCFFSSDEVLS